MIKEFFSCIRNMPRHIATALKNIWRNGVMTISSVFAVSITLIIIGVIGMMAVCIQDITYQVENGLTIHVKMEREATQEEVDSVLPLIEGIAHVANVEYSSKAQELEKLIASFGDDGEIFASEEYQGEGNPLGDAYIVTADDAAYLEEIATKISNLDYVNKTNFGGEETMGFVSTLATIRNFGSIFIVALTITALFMISNTIKITISSRSTEIAIMRMVGASNPYIRIPFMLEGFIIGLLGAIVPCIALYFGYQTLFNIMNGGNSFAMGLITLRNPYPYILYFDGLLAALGCIVGLVGSSMSVRKFLKF